MITLLLACAGAGDDTGAPPIGDPAYERDPALDIALESLAGGQNSHNTGEACMHCHQAHGPGLGRFTVAGSAYLADGTPATEGSIQAWSADGATLLVELPIDGLGNFYTTEDIGLPHAAYVPKVLDAAGNVVNTMPWPTESGSCNQCHTPVRRVVLP